MASFALRCLFALAFVAAAGATVCPACAQDGERPGGLFDIIFGGSERLGGERAAAQPAAEHTAQAAAPDLLLRLERLESQIRQLTGVIEQLQFRNQQLENQVRRMQEDSEGRLQELGAKGSPRPAGQVRPQNVPGPSTPAAIPAPGRRGD